MVGLPQDLTFTTDGRILLQLTGPESAPGCRPPVAAAPTCWSSTSNARPCSPGGHCPRPVPTPDGGRESWRVVRLLPEGLLLVHQTTRKVLAWELFRPDTGELFLVTDLTRLPGPTQ